MHNIHVHPCQRGNPLLQLLVNVHYQMTEVDADFVIGNSSQVLYLSLK